MPLAQFQKLLKSTNQELRHLQQYSNRLTTLRFICFCVTVIFAAASYDTQSLLLEIGTIVTITLFIILVHKHHAIKESLKFTTSRQYILKQYIARFSNDWHTESTTDDSSFIKFNQPLAHDLDLFGNKSLYQYLCFAYTNAGKKHLAELLSNLNIPTSESIVLNQTAIQELRTNPEFCLKFQTLGHLYTNAIHPNKSTKDNPLLNHVPHLHQLPSWQTYLLWLCTIMTPLSLILLTMNLIPPLITICLLFGQFTFSGIFFQRNQFIFGQLHLLYKEISLYRALIKEIEQFPCKSPLIKQLQKNLLHPQAASQKITKLSRINECINMRYNFIFYTIANTLFLWDFHCRSAFINWQLNNGKELTNWLNTIAKMEALLSLNVISFCKQQTAFPKIITSPQPTLLAKQLYHPLLIESMAVPNDIPLNLRTAIITGSNMSGKTTFLRTIGVNAILAYAGAPICGKSMSISPMRLFTSMRISDDINQGISSFYAEILRIKTMAEYTKENQPMLSLIDEIFKGTNSADRIIGAVAAIEKLTLPWSILLVSTHDRELCRLSIDHPCEISNYHFCEYFTNDKISFDYQIKDGPSQTTNAKYLLKMAGIS